MVEPYSLYNMLPRTQTPGAIMHECKAVLARVVFMGQFKVDQKAAIMHSAR